VIYFQVARLIKVTEIDSPYFEVISPSDVGNKVAPGMDKVFMLQFTADQKKVQ
jgi:hydrocephalus-inducing protein